MEQTAITYPQTTVNELTGMQIKALLEDVADNVFIPILTCGRAATWPASAQ